MIKQYFKQAWRILRENPVLSIITILGTALSICMIMMRVMADEVKFGNLAPETKRDRMLSVRSVRMGEKKGGNANYSMLGLKLINELILPLQTPEKTAFYSTGNFSARKPGVIEGKDLFCKMTNEDYWDCFEHEFLFGSPFTEADVKAGSKKVVIRDKWAKEIFETADVVGKSILLDDVEYIICGVVKTMSSLAHHANSNLWIPYTAHLQDDGMSYPGGFRSILLAKNPKDFKKIIEEFNEKVDARNANDPTWDVTFMGQPDTFYVSYYRFSDNTVPDMKAVRTRKLKDYALYLLIPAINLALMTSSRMLQRRHELGVRRAYGARNAQVFQQVIWESLLFTIIGAVLGFFLSLGGMFGLSEILFNGLNVASLNLSVWNYLQPRVFLYAIGFCLLLNLVSAIIPAVKFSRSNIVNNLK
ncbi:FtsX-like permease family protein [Porphyromonadaceae bacterium W3.11]|nr:FtsX-like permease family protein [Porphyromonadaceae bacterium W3.11]